MNRHPVILAQLCELLPPAIDRAPRRPETRLRADLGIPAMQHIALAQMIEEAWGIRIGESVAARWRTLADVCATIADALVLEPA